jgi:hypothetical protein
MAIQFAGAHMSDNTLKHLIASAIALLLVFQIGTLIASIFGVTWGAISAVIVAAVAILSARLAKAAGKSSYWFLLPILIFTFTPIVLMIWRGLTENVSWFDRLVMLTPFIVGFAAPIILLLLVYYELRKRSFES